MKAQIETVVKAKIIKSEEIKTLVEPGEVGATIEMIVFDPKTGRVTEHRPQEKSRSFVRGFMELFWIHAACIEGLLTYPIRDTSNTQHEINATLSNFDCNTPINIDTWGIQVGTGNTAPTINDYKIETQILHDGAPPTAGRMQYSAVTFGAPSSDATTSQFTVTRNFANASGGAITVNEVALVVKGNRYDTDYYILSIRDVIAGGILVPNGQTLTINYRPQAVV